MSEVTFGNTNDSVGKFCQYILKIYSRGSLNFNVECQSSVTFDNEEGGVMLCPRKVK